jgi:glutamyl-tRNA synthetase
MGETCVTNPAHRPVRVRFAPSPTGSLHIGGLRTALFNWLYARHSGGKFILRIEDTDQKRYDPNALTTLMDALRWAGLQWDEGPEVGGAHGPYVQSERLAHYQQWAHWLIENGHAYKCYCTPERLQQVNKEKEARKEQPGYDRRCRNLTPEVIADNDAQGKKHVVRLKMPLEGQTVIHDLVHGEVVFENSTQQDMVMLKSDGFPTYHLAHVVDDHLMDISHILRAVEWLPSAALHMQLWQAFGWEIPQYAHLPVLLNPNGKGKISKRNPPKDKFGNIIPVMVHDYMKAGYVPGAVVNFLSNIGWNFGDEREVFSVDESIQRFNLTRINPANSAFPIEKLEWLNGVYIREMPLEELAPLLRERLEAAGFEVNVETLLRVTPLVQTRIKTLNDVVELAGFFFQETFTPPQASTIIQKKMDAAGTRDALEHASTELIRLSEWTHDHMEAALRALAEELGLTVGQIFGALRVAITGQAVSPPLFESMEIIGKDEVLRRIHLAVQTVDSAS